MGVGSLLKNSSSTLSCPFSLVTFSPSAMGRSIKKAIAEFWNPDTGHPILQNYKFLFFISYPVSGTLWYSTKQAKNHLCFYQHSWCLKYTLRPLLSLARSMFSSKSLSEPPLAVHLQQYRLSLACIPPLFQPLPCALFEGQFHTVRYLHRTIHLVLCQYPVLVHLLQNELKILGKQTQWQLLLITASVAPSKARHVTSHHDWMNEVSSLLYPHLSQNGPFCNIIYWFLTQEGVVVSTMLTKYMRIQLKVGGKRS